MFGIHPDFQLNNFVFSTPNSLLDFLQNNFEEDAVFLEKWFDEQTEITVQTSGSTGIPKSINLLKEDMRKSALATALFFNLSPKTKALHCLPTQYIAGKMMWVRALTLGWHLTLMTPTSNIEIDENKNFDFTALIPLQAQKSLAKLHQFRKIIIGGASVSYILEEMLKKINSEIYVTYGMTETVTHIAVRKIGEELYTALPEISFAIDDRDCLIINTPFRENVITTNDVVKLIDRQHFQWFGRYDNIINSGGIKIIPEKIEQKLIPFIVENFFITALPDEVLGQKIVLLVEGKINHSWNEIFQQAQLEFFEKPKKVIEIEAFEVTPNQKINRKATLEKYLNS